MKEERESRAVTQIHRSAPKHSFSPIYIYYRALGVLAFRLARFSALLLLFSVVLAIIIGSFF